MVELFVPREIREADPENIGKFVVIGTELQKEKIKALFKD